MIYLNLSVRHKSCYLFFCNVMCDTFWFNLFWIQFYICFNLFGNPYRNKNQAECLLLSLQLFYIFLTLKTSVVYLDQQRDDLHTVLWSKSIPIRCPFFIFYLLKVWYSNEAGIKVSSIWIFTVFVTFSRFRQ